MKGSRLLKRWAKAERGRLARLARALNRTPAAASAWKRGVSVPEPHIRPLIERETGGAVPASSWPLSRAEREALAAAAPTPDAKAVAS